MKRRSLWRADIGAGLLLLAFVTGAGMLDAVAGRTFAAPLLPAASVVLALIPAIIWLVIFYRMDRAEPEPRHAVAGVFVLGLLVSAAVGTPLVRDVFRVADWMGADVVVHFLGAFLVIGFIQEVLKYGALRFSVYPTHEFDEMTDGIVYGTAVGLGFATALNIGTFLDAGGVDLGFGAIQATVVSLAHASFGGLVGYFAAGQKLQDQPVWWTAAGLTLAAFGSALFTVVRAIGVTGDLAFNGVLLGPWIGLLLGGAVAIVITGALAAAIRREQTRLTAAPSA